jgi:hypothetical protein
MLRDLNDCIKFLATQKILKVLVPVYEEKGIQEHCSKIRLIRSNISRGSTYHAQTRVLLLMMMMMMT